MKKLKLTFLLFLFFTLGANAQQPKSINKPIRQVTENSLPAPKTEQVSPPVKGVGTVVKRNPGSGASKISGLTNEKGETTLEITEKGNYVVTVVQPTPTGTAMTETQGGPVIGVKVGLGKNPSGLLVRFLPVNDKGEVEFKDLEPGSYTIKIISNDVSCPSGFVMKNGVCEPLPKVATDQPIKAATDIREQNLLMVEDQKIAKSLLNKTVTVLGTTDEGLVIETQNGQQLTVRRKRPPRIIIIQVPPGSIAPKINTSNISKENKTLKLIGTTKDGTLIWENTIGKKCIIESEKGAIVEYVGHVTLLR